MGGIEDRALGRGNHSHLADLVIAAAAQAGGDGEAEFGG